MFDEQQALSKTHTWDLIDPLSGKFIISCKWVYKIHTQSDGSIEQYKSWLVVKGFTQKYDINYEETFALVARLTSVKSLIVIVVV